jgi:hypothetical protein
MVVMSDLLTSTARRGRPVLTAARAVLTAARAVLTAARAVFTAVSAGLSAAGLTLLLPVAAALAGWFAADAGRYGDTGDAVRVGADAWLLAHGAGLSLDTATVTVLPLGLTLLSGYGVYRAGRWTAAAAGLTDAPTDLRPVLGAAGVLATAYGVVAMVTAVLAADPRAGSDVLRALAGGFVLALVAGGAGTLVGSGQAAALRGRSSDWVRAVLVGGAAVVLLLVAGAAFLVTAALLADFGTAATVLSRLHTDGPGGLMYALVTIAFVPNAVLLGVAYLLGPGFAVGAGTVVSPGVVSLGPVPAFPLLAALPDDGATPDWVTALVAAPVLLSLAAAALAARVVPVGRLDLAAAGGLGAGLLAALALTGLVVLAGGSAGPGRMSEVGASAAGTLVAAAVSCGGGGLLGGALGGWLHRRRTGRASAADTASA